MITMLSSWHGQAQSGTCRAVRTFSSMRFWMSSREKGMEESSSNRKEWLAAVLLSTISCFMRPSTCTNLHSQDYCLTQTTYQSFLCKVEPHRHPFSPTPNMLVLFQTGAVRLVTTVQPRACPVAVL